MDNIEITGHLDCEQAHTHLAHCWNDDIGVEFFCNGLES